jgi:hypothetical protein
MTADFVPDTARHEYRQKSWTQIIELVFAVGAIVFGLAIWPNQSLRQSHEILRISLAWLLFVDGAVLLIYVFRTRVVIAGNRIDVVRAFGTHSVEINQIEGFRNVHVRNGVAQLLYLKDSRRTIPLEASLAVDDYFHQWIRQIPEISPRFGSTSKKG